VANVGSKRKMVAEPNKLVMNVQKERLTNVAIASVHFDVLVHVAAPDMASSPFGDWSKGLFKCLFNGHCGILLYQIPLLITGDFFSFRIQPGR